MYIYVEGGVLWPNGSPVLLVANAIHKSMHGRMAQIDILAIQDPSDLFGSFGSGVSVVIIVGVLNII